MVDDFGARRLLADFHPFPYASRILELELERTEREGHVGYVDVERLLTRLVDQPPYESQEVAATQLSLLGEAIQAEVVKRIDRAGAARPLPELLTAFAKYCVSERVTCITLNYDDFMDRALFNARGKTTVARWFPDGGYGFFCRQARDCIGGDLIADMNLDLPMLLLKLHGSVNWKPRRGYSRPYSVDAIVHLEDWTDQGQMSSAERRAVELHLEPQSLIVPPVLTKAPSMDHLALRVVWAQAYEALRAATRVVFVGYGMPKTDMAVHTLLQESMHSLYGPGADTDSGIEVVNLAPRPHEQDLVTEAYRGVLPGLSKRSFRFDGAIAWVEDLVRENVVQP